MNKQGILLTASSPKLGLTFYLTKLAIALKRRGHKVIVISDFKEETNGLSDELKSWRIKQYRINGLDNYINIKSIIELSIVMKLEEFNVIHTSGLIKITKFYLAKLFINRCKQSIVLQIDNISDTKMKNMDNIDISFIRKVIYVIFSLILNTGTDIIIPVSYWTKEKLLGYRVKEDKMVVIHNAVDFEWFDQMVRKQPSNLDFFDDIKDKTIVAQVSTLNRWKGHKYLLISLQKILATNPNVHLLIVGGGPVRQELGRIARKLGISKSVTFTGHVPNYYIPWILSKIDVGVLASLKEQFPRSILEYMAARKPIVATNVGGVSEAVIDGVNGYLVPPKEPSSLAKAILRLLNDPDKMKQMGEKGRRSAEQKFSMNLLTHKLNDVYELAIKMK